MAPEGAQEAFQRLDNEIKNVNERRKAWGMQPLEMEGRNSLVTQRATAQVIADQQRMEAEGRAAEQRARLASETAGKLTRADDPNIARLSQLRQERFDLGDALSDPLARSKLGDTGAVDAAYRARIRAIETLTDAEGNLIGKQELSRRQDQLRLDAINATTAAAKASVAERQKAFDLIGKPLTNSEARDQIGAARMQALAQEAGSKGGKAGSSRGDAQDEFDRALKSADDRMRRQEQEAATYGMGADAVARYRTETDLLAAAKRADRDITSTLTAQVQDYANKAAEAAARTEDLRDRMRTVDQVRNMGSDGIRSVINDLTRGASAADLMNNATSRLMSSLSNMAADQIAEGFLGKRGGSGGIFSLFGSSLGGASANSPLPGAQGPSLETGGFMSIVKGMFGFADGGFTGYGPRLEPAGWVHKGEYVLDAMTTARLGVANLDMMRSTRKGWADGGYVGSASNWTPTPAPAPSTTPVFQTTVINNGNDKVETREVPDGRGGRKQEIIIGEMVATGLKTGPGRQALKQREVARR